MIERRKASGICESIQTEAMRGVSVNLFIHPSIHYLCIRMEEAVYRTQFKKGIQLGIK